MRKFDEKDFAFHLSHFIHVHFRTFVLSHFAFYNFPSGNVFFQSHLSACLSVCLSAMLSLLKALTFLASEYAFRRARSRSCIKVIGSTVKVTIDHRSKKACILFPGGLLSTERNLVALQ